MAEWLDWARGPVFRACLLIMLLGLVRVFGLAAWSVLSQIRRSRRNGRSIPWGEAAAATARWMLPLRAGLRNRPGFGLLSMLFHVTIIVTPIFLGAHILLWERGVGVSWPAIGNATADLLTLIAIVSGVGLFIARIAASTSRSISRAQDLLLPLLIVVPFASGFLAMHPAIHPFDYDTVMFIHVMSGNLLFLLIPFTKISHAALFPATQLVSELGWHLAPGAGQRVAVALGKENEPL